MNNWISVNDMLPAVHRRVIIYMPNVEDTPEFAVGYLENDLNFYYYEQKESIDAIDMELVTHWMPLPEPPI